MGETDLTLLDWILKRYPETPRSRAKSWILAGRVTLAGDVVRQPQRLMSDPGEQLQLLDRHATALDCGKGWQIHPRVSLLYLDGSVAVVNKGPGVIAVPAAKPGISALSILEDYIAGKFKPRTRGPASKPLPAVYRKLTLSPVHRLDQYTSGVFCMACNDSAREQLINQLQSHKMGRQYLAFVEGEVKPPRGTWRHWLQLSEDQMRQQIVPSDKANPEFPEWRQPREAITHYEVVERFKIGKEQSVFSKLRIELETGRKHQIRVQAANEGVPLVGDRIYNPRYGIHSKTARLVEFDRQALHAETLSFDHPQQDNRRMSWIADMPQDLRQLEIALKSGKGYAAT